MPAASKKSASAKKKAKKKKVLKTLGDKNTKTTLIVITEDNEIKEPPKAFTRPGGHVVFVIQNDDENSHTVRIPRDEFLPDPPPSKPKGKPDPIVPLAVDWTTVPANDVAIIQLQVRGKSHFDKGDWTYKYTIYWADDIFGTNEQYLDPQIEINN